MYGYPLVDGSGGEKSVAKFQDQAQTYWDKFYKANGDRFFKDRHWIVREFPELLQTPDAGEGRSSKRQRAAHESTWHETDEPEALPLVLDIGCGVGNTLFPVDAATGFRYRWASIDLSETAISIVRSNARFDASRHTAFVCDFVTQPIPADLVPAGGCQVATLFFVLSAIAPRLHSQALAIVFAALKEGGVLLFRDYHRQDHAETRFQDGGRSQIGEHFFVRQDGTQSYFFEESELQATAEAVGFQVARLAPVKRDLSNRKEALDIKAGRSFLQGVFMKPKG